MKSFLSRIERNYNFSNKNLEKNHKSRYWKKSIKKKQGLFSFSNLKNFRSNGLSDNIDEFFISKKKFDSLIKFLIKNYDEKFVLKLLNNKNIGNCKYYRTYKNKIITPTDISVIYYLEKLIKNVDIKRVSVACEIGQGFGMFASKLLKLKKLKMILIDLPESNFITAYYLHKVFPKKKIILDIDLKNKKKLDQKTLKKGDIFILSPKISLGDIKVDLFINMRSMMEMNIDVIKRYFELIHEKISTNGFFFSVNRYYKDLVGYPIEFHSYPYDNYWKVVKSMNSKLQKSVHILLTKRVSLFSDSINSELKKIKKIHHQKIKLDPFFFRRYLPPLIYSFYKKIKFFYNK
jgi:putative sugar O-methyltransferase